MIDLIVFSDGTTTYKWTPTTSIIDGIPVDDNAAAHLKHLDDRKGWCLTALRNYTISNTIISSQAHAAVVIGSHHQRVCARCFRVSRAKVVNRSDCPSLCYCSQECLHHASMFLDSYGSCIQQLYEWGKDSDKESLGDFKDHAILTTILVWQSVLESQQLDINSSSSSEFDLTKAVGAGYLSNSLMNVLKLESQSSSSNNIPSSEHATILSGVNRAAHRLSTLLESSSPSLLPTRLGTSGIEIVMKAVYFNAQPLPVPGLAGTSILTILPECLARINHSCRPNAVLTYSLVQQSQQQQQQQQQKTANNNNEITSSSNRSKNFIHSGICPLSVQLIAASNNTITVNTPLTISYLSQLCSPVETRRQLLREAFCFHCECERCLSEESESKNKTELHQDGGGVKDTEDGVEALEQMVQYLVNQVSSSSSSSSSTTITDGKSRTQQPPTFRTLLNHADRQMQQLLAIRKHGGVGDTKRSPSDCGILDTGGNSSVKLCSRVLYAVHDAALLVVNHALHQRLTSRKASTTTTTTTTTTTAPPLDKKPSKVQWIPVERHDHDNDLLLVHGTWLVHKVSEAFSVHLTQSVAHSADMLLGAIAAGMRLLQQLPQQLPQQQLSQRGKDNSDSRIDVLTRTLALAASSLLQLYYPNSHLSIHHSTQSNQMHISTTSFSSTSSSSSSSMTNNTVTPLHTSISHHTTNEVYLQQAFAIIHSSLSYGDK